jgi:hypothetical protein
LMNNAIVIFSVLIFATILYPILLWLWILFPLFAYVGLGYFNFFPKVLAKFFAEEKSVSGLFKLIALQYVRTYALLAGLLKYQFMRLLR